MDATPAIRDQGLVGSTFHKGSGGGEGKTFPQGFFTVGFSLYDMIAEPLHYILSWYLITGKAEPNRRLLTLQS